MDDESGSRLSAILKNVITTEINLRTADFATTEQNINTVREYLNRTRQGVCADFYDDGFKTTLQKPAHRAAKKTFTGKEPIKQEPLDSDHDTLSSTSQWSSENLLVQKDAVNCKTVAIKQEPLDLNDTEGLKQENSDADEDTQPKYLDPDEKLNQMSGAEKRRPRYIPPVIPVSQIQHGLKPRGNKTMKKVRFLVRNNSKYILTPEDTSGATHKWSLNLKLNDESMDISQIVSKVVFYLHPSYKPHDVVTVNSAPFKITRRGWGEFDLRIKIFFVNEKDEPVAVNHPLVFDKLHSGMETFGGETIFDHWILEPSEPIVMSSVDGIVSSRGDESDLSNRTDHPIPSAITSIPTHTTTTFDDLSTMPFTNETSKHFLSAIFGEPEELSAAKKDWEQFDNLFNLDDLAFPEFFGFGVNDPKISSTDKSGDRDSQHSLLKVVAAPGNLADVSLDEKSCPIQSVSSITSNPPDDDMSSAKNQCSDRVDSLVTDLITIEPACESNAAQTSKPPVPNAQVPPEVTTHVGESSDQNRDCELPVPVENIKQELYLSDLSEFGDEVIIIDSNDDEMNQSHDQPKEVAEEQISTHEKHVPECGGVDYSSMEMDDLIKFPTDKPSSSGVKPRPRFTSPGASCPVYMVATSKSSAVSPKKHRRSNAVVKAPPQSVLKAGVKLVTKPNPTLLTTSSNLSSVMSTKCVANSPPTTVFISSSNLPSIITPKITSQSHPTTLLVGSSVISPKGRPTPTGAHQKTSAKNSNRTIVRKVAAPRNSNTSVVSSINSITKGGSHVSQVYSPSTSKASLQSSLAVPMRSVVTSANPVAITTGGQPITLLSVINTSSVNTLVSKTSPIVINSPKVGSQATPTLLVPSSMILKPALSKTVNSAVVGQVNNPILSQAIPLAPKTKGSKLVGNVMKMSPAQVGIRPGGTRFLVKMPDGTLKPINLESLTPLKSPELRIANPVASSSRPHLLTPQPVLIRPPVAPTVVSSAIQHTASRGKRSAPTNIMPVKRRKTEPKTATSSANVRTQRAPIILSKAPQVVFKLPQSSKQLLVVPQAANQPVIRLQSHQGNPHSNPPSILKDKVASPTPPAVGIRRKTAVNSELPSNLMPKLEGMSILKRRPPETEVDARSLIENCPRYSTEVSICWLLRKFPLVHSRAGEESFKQAFPYCARNTAQFNQWPCAKRRAHELLRAIDVLQVAKKIYPSCDWKKLDVVKFARLRGFTPLLGKTNLSIHIHKPVIKDRCSIADIGMLTRMMASHQEIPEDVDITSLEEDKSRQNALPSTQLNERKGKIFMTLQGQVEDAKVVEQWVEGVSIYPEPEEIEPGIMFPAALRVLVSAFHSFAEDLVRRSYSSSYLRHNSREPHIVAPEDVQLALFSRQEFDLFTKQGLGVSCAKAKKNRN